MATTRLMPLHAGKGRTVAEALGRTTDYVKNPEKTNGGDLVTAYQCNPSIVDQEFLFSKRQYSTITGRDQKEHDVIAYHLRQSFKPGEVTPELANKIGYFDGLGLKKLPSMQSLKQEYAALLAENKKLYPEQKKAKAEMMELLTAKHNTERILGITEDEKRREQRQEER